MLMQTNSIAGNILTICNSFSKESNTTGLVVKKDNNMKNLGLCLNDREGKIWFGFKTISKTETELDFGSFANKSSILVYLFLQHAVHFCSTWMTSCVQFVKNEG